MGNIAVLESESLSKFVFKEESHSGIPIEVNVPERWHFNYPIVTLDHAYEIAKKELPEIEKLAVDAFANKDKRSWQLTQNTLYIWNAQDIFRKNIVDNRFVLQTILRNKILQVEQNNSPKHRLECQNNFTVDRAVQELADKAHAHRINTHPLTTELSKNGISSEHVKVFLNNYYVNNRLFHLFIATLSLLTPLEGRTELSSNFYDELGSGDNAMAHPVLFLKNFNSFGRPQVIKPHAEALYLVNSKLYAAFLSGNYHYGMGGFGFIELTMPNQMIRILDGLRKSKVPENDLEFWRIHISIDLEHGKHWFEEMRNLVTTPQQAQDCLQGGMTLLEARATMYDGIWNEINKR